MGLRFLEKTGAGGNLGPRESGRWSATCKKLWARLLSGLVLDALVEGVNQLLYEVRNAAWTLTEVVGEGQEYRAEFNGKVGSALLLDGTLVHGSLVA